MRVVTIVIAAMREERRMICDVARYAARAALYAKIEMMLRDILPLAMPVAVVTISQRRRYCCVAALLLAAATMSALLRYMLRHAVDAAVDGDAALPLFARYVRVAASATPLR